MCRIKQVVLAICFFFFTVSLFSNPVVDSLKQEIASESGEKKLYLMFQLAMTYQDTEEAYMIATSLEKESKTQRNAHYLLESYGLKAKYFLQKNNADSILYYSSLMNNLYEDYKDYGIEVAVPNYYYSTAAYLALGYNDIAIHELKLLLEKHPEKDIVIYNLLGNAYYASGKYNLAAEYFQKSIDLSQSWIDSASDPTLEVSLYPGLISSLIREKKYEEALAYCPPYEKAINKNVNILPQATVNTYLLNLYLFYTTIYTSQGDKVKSKMYLDKIEKTSLEGVHEKTKDDIEFVKSKYYHLIKDYNKALEHIEVQLELDKTTNPQKVDLEEHIMQKINILYDLGKYKDAFKEQQLLTSLKDSLYQHNMPLQMSQISKNYELEKAKLEQSKKDAQLEKTQAVVVGLIITTLLLCTIIILIRRNSNKLREKNKTLFKQNVELDKYVSHFKKEFIATEEREKEDEEEVSLFERLEIYMKKDEPYKNPNLTKTDVVEFLNTNRQYLTDAIKNNTGKSYLEYINEYRLNYARHCLLFDELTPIGNIILDAGFASNATFYRLFKARFGMTPNELRQAKSEMMGEKSDL